MRVLIVGCGYVGLPLGVELVRLGHEVSGLRRNVSAENELKAAGIQPLFGDVTKPETLARLPREFDWVVNCVAAGGDADDYRQVYLQGTRNLIEWLAPASAEASARQALKKFVYTSSTSVYGQTDGSQVKESSPTEPLAETAKVLLETEKAVAGGGGRTQVSGRDFARGRHLRAGPRPLVQAIPEKRGADGRRRLAYPEHDSPRRFDRLHHRGVEERAARRNLQRGGRRAGEPVALFPVAGPGAGQAAPAVRAGESAENRKRGVTNKRVSNRKLKMELGYQFKYPNFRKGYSAELLRLDRAG